MSCLNEFMTFLSKADEEHTHNFSGEKVTHSHPFTSYHTHERGDIKSEVPAGGHRVKAQEQTPEYPGKKEATRHVEAYQRGGKNWQQHQIGPLQARKIATEGPRPHEITFTPIAREHKGESN